MTMKIFAIVLASQFVVACAMPERLPKPTGPSVPVNSIATAEMLVYEAGYMLVGSESGKPDVKEKMLHNRQLKLFRQKSPEEFARVRGARLVERTVIVPFSYGSAEFLPSPEQQFQLILLTAAADRVEVRGRTDGRGDRVADEKMAHLRAEAAKRYLLWWGVPSSDIAVNYQAAGDYIADNELIEGRGMNRRVELEFYIDDFTADRVREYAIADPLLCNQPVKVKEWQTVGETNNKCLRIKQ